MITAIKQSQIYVLDQDEALDFYVGTLGFEVHTDVDLGFMRWLTICVPGQRDHEILLEVPGPPAMSPETAAQVRDSLTKGAAGGWFALSTDDPYGLAEIWKQADVDFTDEPSEKPYGVDFGIRDPFGNKIRVGKTN